MYQERPNLVLHEHARIGAQRDKYLKAPLLGSPVQAVVSPFTR